MFLIIFPT